MHITRNSVETTVGPSEWFTGSVYMDPVAAPSGASRLSASRVHFTPGARTVWHSQPSGQTIYVTEGMGLARSPKKHVKFREKYNLPFTLLSDEEHEVAEQYGTWVEKSMYGRTYMGMERSTFVIDVEGNVATVMRKVKPADHADDVLAALP